MCSPGEMEGGQKKIPCGQSGGEDGADCAAVPAVGHPHWVI